MRFGPEPSLKAEGGLLAHALRGKGFAFKKGRRLSAADADCLAAAGIAEVMVARLDADDVAEDDAAAAIGAALAAGAPPGCGLRIAAPTTGRSNLYAKAAGVARIGAARIAAVNAINEAITVATLPADARVDAGQMVATVKIIPLAVQRSMLERAVALAAADGTPALTVAPFRPHRAVLIQTALPGQKPALFGHTRELIAARLADLGSDLVGDLIVPHRTADLATALAPAGRPSADIVLVIGASAIVDRRDVIPAAIESAGGAVERFGMPVEPGNLLLLGRLGEAVVVGLPGCARTAKLNGFDWVLERLCAGIPVGGAAIAAMGVGGLLVDSRERRPREHRRPAGRAAADTPGDRVPQIAAPVIAAVVLAAGRGVRFGAAPKLASEYRGEPLLRAAVRAALAAGARPVIVVLGHEAARLKGLIAELPVIVVENSRYAEGIAGSLGAGLAAVPAAADGAIVMLGDMPKVAAAHIRLLIRAFDPAAGREICVPTWEGRRGNPVLWARRLFDDLRALTGDQGGRALFDRYAASICEVPMPDDGVLFDVDEPSALARAALAG